MGSVPRPLLGLLVASVALFAIWTVALKPHGSSSSPSGAASYQSAVGAAKNVQHVVDSASAKAGGSPATTSAPAASASKTPALSTHKHAQASPAAQPAATHIRKPAASAIHKTAPPPIHKPIFLGLAAGATSPAARLTTAASALQSGKVLALLFYNPSGADDVAVKQELDAISTHGGKVVKLAVPLDELPNYAVVTSQVPVNFAPTLVIVDPTRHAMQIAGFADGYEIAQRIDDALALSATR